MEDILCSNIRVLRFKNEPVPSNSYLLEDGSGKHCIVIDPGCKYQGNIIDYIKHSGLQLDYIILTHEHFDHCWGVNSLLDFFSSKVVATRLCAKWLKVPRNYFNQLYYNSDEMYQINQFDILIEGGGSYTIPWGGTNIKFVITPGHTDKGMCIEIEGRLFTGDTLLFRTKPFLKKKYGASKADLYKSILSIYQTYPDETIIYPGHGEPFLLKNTKLFYEDYFSLHL